MSSNIRIEKTCEWCGNQFTAQTTVTRFCSKRCAEHSYKERMRQRKIEKATKKKPEDAGLKDKDFLTVAETASLLGLTRQGVYNLIGRGVLAASRLSSRLTLIKMESIERMLDASPYQKQSRERTTAITEFYTSREIQEKFGISNSGLYKAAEREGWPKTLHLGKTLWSKRHVDAYFKKLAPKEEIKEWYSVEDIQAKYGMTLSAIYCLVSKVGIPKKKEGSRTLYSKYHFDVAKGAKSAEDEEFISTAEAMEKYSLTRDQLHHYVKTHNITKLREGKYVKLKRSELDRLYNPEIKL